MHHRTHRTPHLLVPQPGGVASPAIVQTSPCMTRSDEKLETPSGILRTSGSCRLDHPRLASFLLDVGRTKRSCQQGWFADRYYQQVIDRTDLNLRMD